MDTSISTIGLRIHIYKMQEVSHHTLFCMIRWLLGQSVSFIWNLDLDCVCVPVRLPPFSETWFRLSCIVQYKWLESVLLKVFLCHLCDRTLCLALCNFSLLAETWRHTSLNRTGSCHWHQKILSDPLVLCWKNVEKFCMTCYFAWLLLWLLFLLLLFSLVFCYCL